MAEYDYDLFTIGAGSGGVRASRLSASYGAKVAIAEESRIGGTCVIRGCVPKKLLVYAAHFAEDFKDAEGYGWSIAQTEFDWPRLIAAKNSEITRLQEIYTRILRDNGVSIVNGRARIVGPHEVDVAGRRYSARHILIAVGGWPALPAIPGIEHAITSNDALDLPTLPRRMVIVGGGYIAVEFAGIFNALGVEVTQILRGDTVLRGFDDDIRSALADEMRKKGIRLLCESTVKSIETRGDGYRLRLDGDEELETDLVMYATGRRPKTQGLGLEEVGVALDDETGAVIVNESFQSSVPSIYAIGDVSNRINLTPVAINEGRCLAQSLYGGTPMTMNYDDIPSAVFSQPPVGSVGLSEQEARRRYGAIDIYVTKFRPMRHTLSGRDERTMMKLVVDQNSQRVVGCHMVGADAPEIIQGFAVAVKAGATKRIFDETVGIHPTAAEEFVTMRDKRPPPSAKEE